MDVNAASTGLMMGLSLIVAIGAQNAFVLKQGLKRNHVFVVSLICALSDAVLILLGVTSLGSILKALPWLDPVMRFGGAGFLVWYGLRSLRAALTQSSGLEVGDKDSAGLWPTVWTCLALTWLNPHVYLDTVVLLGTVSTRFPGAEASFALGAMSGSLMFFFALGYGARLLRPFFARPRSWQILDLMIAAIMLWIALRLLTGG